MEMLSIISMREELSWSFTIRLRENMFSMRKRSDLVMTIRIAEDGGADYDQILGSILERWLTTKVPKNKCRFCRKELKKPAHDPKNQFCDQECFRGWQKVMAARLAIGKRDLKQRGYD
jgi:hypothetical protein